MRAPAGGLLAALCALSLAAPLSAAQQDTLSARPGTSGTELTFQGSTFHHAAGAVHDLRLIPVAGTSVLLALWNEERNGALVPHYAISQNGASFVAVRETSYELQLRRMRFDPLQTTPDFSNSPLPASADLQIVQFQTQPLAEFRAQIEALGGAVHAYLPYHAYLVRMTPAVRDQVRELPFVRWVGGYHPEYRLEESVLAGLASGELQTGPYVIRTFESGLAQKQLVAGVIRQMGGTINALVADGFLMEVTLSPEQLAVVASLDEVMFIDPHGQPGTDMDIARDFSNSNYLQSLTGFTGQGVRGEVLDGGVRVTHLDFVNNGGTLLHGANTTDTSHGTSTTGIVFGAGSSTPAARGGLPAVAPGGQIINSAYTVAGGAQRKTYTMELTNPALVWQAVFQSNSWGNSLTTTYNNFSAGMDDIIYDSNLLIFQSQSNANSQNSRPEAWSKNIVSVGGIQHNNTLSDSDDGNSGASYGPAADGRFKPDLAHFYDSVTTSSSSSNSAFTTSFGGTSAATPITAGHAGYLFQLWHDNAFGNNPTGATVFASRPHYETAKAAIINTATQWKTANATFLERRRQGWGRVDLKRLYDLRNSTFFVNRQVLGNLATLNYPLNVPVGGTEFKVTMVYRDRPGTTSASIHRINDISLKVTSPGGTIYFGNNGLDLGRWSTAGGVANTKDTVENVFIQNPAAGTWLVEVIGADINTDLPEYAAIPGNQADFSLWATGITNTCSGSGIVYCTAQLNSQLCFPAIASTGSASASSPSGMVISCANMIPGQPGVLFYSSNGAAATPFQNGTLCMTPPTQRTGVQNSGGAGPCGGAYSLDFNTWIAGGADPALVAGVTVYAQYWSRDPGDSFGTNLSNAVQFTICQ